jgi:hypothetical protein
MSPNTEFDGRRSAAMRELIVSTAKKGDAPRAHKRVALLVSLIIAALLVSGGGVAYALGIRFVPAPAVTASSTPTPTPTPTPPPTTAPATPAPPIDDPSDPASWIIDFDGVGPVKLGSSLTDNKQLPAFTDVTDPVCVNGQLNLTAQEGWDLSLYAGATSHDTAETIALSYNFVRDGDRELHTPKTSEGIGIGATLLQLQASYPAIAQTGDYGDGLMTYYGVTNDSGTWIVFAVLHDTVTAIQVGPDKTMPSEHCPA